MPYLYFSYTFVSPVSHFELCKFWSGACGALQSFGYSLSFPAVVCHAIQLFSSEPVLECLLWNSEVPSAHTNTFIYVCV